MNQFPGEFEKLLVVGSRGITQGFWRSELDKILNSSLNTAISPRLKMLCLCSWMVIYGRRWFPRWSRQSSLWSTGTPSSPKVKVIHASNVILLWLHVSLWDDWSLKHTFSWKKTILLKQRHSSKRHSLIRYLKQIGNWLVTSSKEWECQNTLQMSQITMSIFQPKNAIIFCSLNRWFVSSQ